MNSKKTILWMMIALSGITAHSQVPRVNFSNNSTSRVTFASSGLPVAGSNGIVVTLYCAPDGVTQGFLTAVAEVFPTFIRHNKGQPNLTGLPMSPVAANFYSAEGPDLLGKYAPWAVDIMPMPTWIQLGVAFSVLFSGMALWHRFRLWRVDANRVKIEREVAALFTPGATLDSIAAMPLDARHLVPEARAQIDDLILRLSELSARCRQQSLSVLVPMGEEMSYRYQETLIADLLRALRLHQERLPPG